MGISPLACYRSAWPDLTRPCVTFTALWSTRARTRCIQVEGTGSSSSQEEFHRGISRTYRHLLIGFIVVSLRYSGLQRREEGPLWNARCESEIVFFIVFLKRVRISLGLSRQSRWFADNHENYKLSNDNAPTFAIHSYVSPILSSTAGRSCRKICSTTQIRYTRRAKCNFLRLWWWN